MAKRMDPERILNKLRMVYAWMTVVATVLQIMKVLTLLLQQSEVKRRNRKKIYAMAIAPRPRDTIQPWAEGPWQTL